MNTASVRQILTDATQLLDNCDACEDSHHESQILLAFSLGKDRSWLYAWPEKQLDKDQISAFNQLLTKRAKGTPIAYITGKKEFWSLELDVNEHTLIPRPDTEILIETVLDLYPQESISVLDMGTGSGAIALALASEKPNWKITASDQSNEALTVAKSNAEKLSLTVNFVQGSWFQALTDSQQFDLIVSNPPYIEDQDPHLVTGDLRYEPNTALASGKDGLTDIRHIISHCANHLKPTGRLILEHGYQQANDVITLLTQAGMTNTFVQHDLAGHERISGGQLTT